MTWVMLLSVFCIGFTVGATCERASLRIAQDKTTLIYEGSVYVRAIPGNSLQDYLTAAGKK